MNSIFKQPKSIGRYTVLGELGRGGMSVVYLANDIKLGRQVAIKCVDSQNDTTASLTTSLRAEAKLLAQLNHANVVQLYDVVEQDNLLGLVIEYVGGESLTHRLQQNPSRELKLKWLAEISEGIASAHKHGITHCDIKADNILITVDNIAKVADFGIAKLKLDNYIEADGLARKGSVTASYFSLSPEQASGQAVDHRTDIFSLAVLIHQTLVSKHPFGDTSNKTDLIKRVINDPFKLTDSALNVFGVRLSELISNSLSKLPKERLYDADEMAELLKNEVLNSVDNIDDDYTVAIATQQPERINSKGLIKYTKAFYPKLVFIFIGVLLSVVAFNWLSPSKKVVDEVSYIALDNITVTLNDDFNEELRPLIKSTILQSAENTLLSFNQTGMVDAKELNAVDGSYSVKAKASGVEDVLVASADCFEKKCDIKIQHRSGQRMAVTKQTNFPVAVDSLVGLKNAISSQISTLLNRNQNSFSQRDLELSEENYRRYLEVYLSSNQGVTNDQQYFEDVEELIDTSPSFIPAYKLLYRLSAYLHRDSGEEEYLLKVLEVLENAPNYIQNNKEIKGTKIRLLLDLGKLDESKMIFNLLKGELQDELFISKIESSIAYAEDDYDKLLLLDRQNAIWRPSADNLYNLASSEFYFGNHDKAKEVVVKALSLSPNDSYALNLKATIETNLGNFHEAINAYEALLLNNSDSKAYSNYSLALTLNKEFQKAVTASEKAIQINPNEPLYYLNLADIYALSGERGLSRINYQKVVSMLQEPKTGREFSYLAQAYAHLGEFNKAVKNLKIANKKFSDFTELDYAASIVNTLSGNYVSAVVDVSDAIEGGTAPIWFSFEWFKPLCVHKGFITMTGAATLRLCKVE